MFATMHGRGGSPFLGGLCADRQRENGALAWNWTLSAWYVNAAMSFSACFVMMACAFAWVAAFGRMRISVAPCDAVNSVIFGGVLARGVRGAGVYGLYYVEEGGSDCFRRLQSH